MAGEVDAGVKFDPQERHPRIEESKEQRHVSFLVSDPVADADDVESKGSIKLRRINTLKQDKAWSFDGPSQKLMSFLNERKESKRLDEKRYMELTAAVQSMGSKRKRKGGLKKMDGGMAGLAATTKQESVPSANSPPKSPAKNTRKLYNTVTTLMGAKKAAPKTGLVPGDRASSRRLSRHSTQGKGIKTPTVAALESTKTMCITFMCEGNLNVLDMQDWDAISFAKEPTNISTNKDVEILKCMFVSPFDMVEKYKLDLDRLHKWIVAIREMYRTENGYHNWAHALEVTHFLHYMLVKNSQRYFSSQDVLALHCAAIAHDVGHFGVNATFMARTYHPVGLLFNDKSPMENMHASLFFKTLYRGDSAEFGNRDLNFLQEHGRKVGKFNNLRNKVVMAILGTDITKHFDMVDEFKSLMNRHEAQAAKGENLLLEDPDTADKRSKDASKDERLLLIEAMLHTADLSHNCKQFDVHKWGLLGLEEEWFSQGDLERDIGIPVSGNFDRTKDSAATAQSFFLLSMVRPLVQPWQAIFNKEHIISIVDNIEFNDKRWLEAVGHFGKRPVHEIAYKTSTTEFLDDQKGPITFSEDIETVKAKMDKHTKWMVDILCPNQEA